MPAFMKHVPTLLFSFYTLHYDLVQAATTHFVNVGLQGSFFDPPTLSVGLNDTVRFMFVGLVHTVTQGSLQKPCIPLPGGFSSGAAGVIQTNGTMLGQSWDLIVTNVSQPIWYFCEISTPISHCESGMVGAINPPSIDTYNQFLAAAKAVTSTPSPAVTPVLTGIGAFVTQNPVLIVSSVVTLATSLLSTSSASSTSSTTSTQPTNTAEADNSGSHIGAIVGGAVGGVIAVVFVILFMVWFFRRRKDTSPLIMSPTTERNFFRYNATPVRRPNAAFVAEKKLEEESSNQEATPPNRPFSPIRRQHNQNHNPLPGGLAFMPTHKQMNNPPSEFRPPGDLDRQRSFQSTTGTSQNHSVPLSPTTATDLGHPNSTINMHALANEVATILRTTPSSNTLGAALSAPKSNDNLTDGHQHSKQHWKPEISERRTDTPLGPPAYGIH